MKNNSSTTLQHVASTWLRAAQERQLETDPHRHPVHKPVPDVAFNSSRRRDCTPLVEINQKPFGATPQTRVTSSQHPAIQPTDETTELTQARLQYQQRLTAICMPSSGKSATITPQDRTPHRLCRRFISISYRGSTTFRPILQKITRFQRTPI
jgi:hypothetical protein